MSSTVSTPRIATLQPAWAIPGGRVSIVGRGFSLGGPTLPGVRVGGTPARVVCASTDRIDIIVPRCEGGRQPVRVDGTPGETPYLEIGTRIATGLHLVDSPAFAPDGTLYVTYSGSRDQRTPVSVYRIPPGGIAEPFSSVANPTSLAVDGRSRVFVSSRFEGTVYRLEPDGTPVVVATDLGVPCGLAVDELGTVFVGDRSGAVLRIRPGGEVHAVATLPASVAAFHLALGPDGSLYVTGPTLSSHDNLYRITEDGEISELASGFGRPQGLAFDSRGTLFAIEALAGVSGMHRIAADGRRELVLAGANLIGVAFDPTGGLVVATSDSVFRFDVGLRGVVPAPSDTEPA